MKTYLLYQQEFGAPPPPPPPGGTTPPPPPSGSMQSDKAGSKAIWALILGIAAWVLGCSILTGIPAWIIGKKEINEIEAGQSSPAGKTMAQIGMWLGLINTILSILVLIGVLLYFVVIVALIGSNS